MWYIIIPLIITSVVLFILGTLLVKHSENKLKENQRKLASTLSDYALVLKIYKRILEELKSRGEDISQMPIPWKNDV